MVYRRKTKPDHRRTGVWPPDPIPTASDETDPQFIYLFATYKNKIKMTITDTRIIQIKLQ